MPLSHSARQKNRTQNENLQLKIAWQRQTLAVIEIMDWRIQSRQGWLAPIQPAKNRNLMLVRCLLSGVDGSAD